MSSHLSYVIIGNSLKQKSDESKNNIVVLKKEITVLEDKKRKLQK